MSEGALPVGSVPEAVETAAREQAAAAGRVVVKAGTNSLTDAESQLDRVKLDKLVTDVMDLRERGTEVLLVSSGAVGAGRGRIDEPTDSVVASQALSTVGQSDLMAGYTASFGRYDQKVAQMLLTEDDLEDPERFQNVRSTVETLFDWGVVPVVNENDAVATEEIQIGDNDMLSASVAIGVDADLLVILTDVGGVYTSNPKADPDAELITAVGDNYETVQRAIGGGTDAEFGGIQTKVEGGRDVSRSGMPAVIANSQERQVLDRIVASKPVGTVFVPEEDETDA
ncbi:MAG: glutamate 5-kinase [Natronomonas sp.]|jgi:glutamate 5-kinase